jgi:aarF domain-containing kinase
MLEAFSQDLYLLQQWGVFMDAWTSVVTHQKPYHKDFLENFAMGGYGELDYELEAQNQRHFQEQMNIRSCPIVIPNVYDNLTTRRVLTTEWMDGIRLSDADPETIRRLIPVGVELFLCQLLDIGAFHGMCHQVGYLNCTLSQVRLTLYSFDASTIWSLHCVADPHPGTSRPTIFFEGVA